jgi:hypothetical protein
MGLLGILVGLGLLIWLAFRGWSVLLLAPAAGLVAAAFGGEPLLANWTQIFMGSAAGFLAQFFPIFLLGAVFGKLMDDSGSVSAVAAYMTKRLGEHRAMLAVVLAGAFVTYGGVSLFVAFFVLAPMAQALFRSAAIPRPRRSSLAPRPSPCRRCRARHRFKTPSRCRSSAPRRLPRLASASSPRSSCLAAAYGGSPAPRRQPAAPAKAMERMRQLPPMQRPMMSWFASGRPPHGNSIPQRCTTDIQATPLHRSRLPHYRLSLSWRSIF